MLHFNKVSRIYDDGTRAIDQVELKIEKGEFCVLLGPSGAGKSTLMGMVNGLVEPSDGEFLFDGQQVTKSNLKQLQRRVGMIHQQLHLVSRLSVIHNVMAGVLPSISTLRSLFKVFPLEDQRRACRLLEEVGMEEKHIYRRASALSGGQQQRVAIARAFMPNPNVVLADEPVASLDPKMSRSVLTLLKRAAQLHGATVLCSLHQVEYAMEFADRIIGLRQGQLIYEGNTNGFTRTVMEDLYGEEQTPEPLEEIDEPNLAGELKLA